MKNTIITIISGVVIIGTAHLLKYFYGFQAKVIFAGIILVVSIAMSIAHYFLKTRLRRTIASMTEEQRNEYFEECRREGVGDVMEGLDEPALSWMGKTIDVIGGVAAAFLPPLIYHFATVGPLTWNSNFTGWHLACMTAGVLVYVLLRKRIVYRFMKPPNQASEVTARKLAEPQG